MQLKIEINIIIVDQMFLLNKSLKRLWIISI